MENLILISSAIILFNAACLWLGMLIAGVDGPFFKAVIIAGLTPLIAFLLPIPMARWLVILIAQLILLESITETQFWPDGVMVVGISYVVGTLGGMLLLGMLLGGRALSLV